MKYVAFAVPRYRMELQGHEWFEPQATTDRNRVISAIRTARLAGLPLLVTLLAPKVEQLPACSWCRARPRAVEYDCDGSYFTATCDAPQCREARRLAYDGIIAYPFHQRRDDTPRIVKPVLVHRADGPRPGVVTVDEYDDITCLCGNIPSNAGFHPCFPGGAVVELDDPEFASWDGLYWCAGVGCPGVIVDCRYIEGRCSDCTAREDAPPAEYHASCVIHWKN